MSRKFRLKKVLHSSNYHGFLNIDSNIGLSPKLNLPYVDMSYVVGHYVGSSFRIDFISDDFSPCLDFIHDHDFDLSDINYVVYRVSVTNERILGYD